MARIVMKFGGTSMAGTERIRRVANIVRKQAAGGNEVAVVVSAMAGETDRLVNFCREANPLYDPAEYDVVVASGEQVTSGLLALTLQQGIHRVDINRPARDLAARIAEQARGIADSVDGHGLGVVQRGDQRPQNAHLVSRPCLDRRLEVSAKPHLESCAAHARVAVTT